MQDLAIEKLKLIEWLARLQDPNTLKKLIALKKENELPAYNEVFPKMTQEQLLKNLQASEEDIKLGRVSDIESIETENWD